MLRLWILSVNELVIVSISLLSNAGKSKTCKFFFFNSIYGPGDSLKGTVWSLEFHHYHYMGSLLSKIWILVVPENCKSPSTTQALTASLLPRLDSYRKFIFNVLFKTREIVQRILHTLHAAYLGSNPGISHWSPKPHQE